jgi:hypothetical protein
MYNREKPPRGLPPETASNPMPRTGLDSTRRRRRESWRLPELDCRRSDPWFYPEPGERGYEAAAHHLLEHGLIPAPNVPAMQLMWRRSDRSRRAAGLIAQRWGLAS